MLPGTSVAIQPVWFPKNITPFSINRRPRNIAANILKRSPPTSPGSQPRPYIALIVSSRPHTSTCAYTEPEQAFRNDASDWRNKHPFGFSILPVAWPHAAVSVPGCMAKDRKSDHEAEKSGCNGKDEQGNDDRAPNKHDR